MKKIIAYALGFFACAWLINRAIQLILEVWQVLFVGIGLFFAGWLTFRIIKTNKDWR